MVNQIKYLLVVECQEEPNNERNDKELDHPILKEPWEKAWNEVGDKDGKDPVTEPSFLVLRWECDSEVREEVDDSQDDGEKKYLDEHGFCIDLISF